MVYEVILQLAHGADPTPLDWDEALANVFKMGVTFLMVALMSYPVLKPMFAADQEDAEEDSETRKGLIGWIGLGLLLLLAMTWWLARSSVVEVMTEEPRVKEDHAHTQVEGGQIAMWGDFHAEVVRVESGEVRVFLSDSYNRPIAARFFSAEVAPLETVDGEDQPSQDEDFKTTVASLDDTYRLVRLSREEKAFRVKVGTPGWSVTLKFKFDEDGGRRSLPIWCGTPNGGRPLE